MAWGEVAARRLPFRSHAPAAMAHESTNSPQLLCVFGAVAIAGIHTSAVKVPSMTASRVAASRGGIENRTPRPAARGPATAKDAQPVWKGRQAGTSPAVSRL